MAGLRKLSRQKTWKMAEGVGLEPTSPKAPVFKTGGLPVILTLRGRRTLSLLD